MSIKAIVTSTTTSIAAVLLYLFGDFDEMLIALFLFVLIDFVTGILKAIYNKDLKSDTMYKGGIKKIGLLLVVAIANILDNAMNLAGVLRSVAIGYYIANEGISILENWGSLGLPLPPQLKGILEQLKNDKNKVD